MDKTKPKGLDYLVMDDFYEIFDLNEDDLLYARSEAEEIWTSICKNEIKIE